MVLFYLFYVAIEFYLYQVTIKSYFFQTYFIIFYIFNTLKFKEYMYWNKTGME